MKKLFFLLAALFAPALAFAQDGGGEGGLDLDLMMIVATLITGVGIPLAVQILKQVWPSAPALLKTLGPVIFPPLLLLAGTAVSQWLGIEIDFRDIIDVFLAVTAVGAASTTAFKLGKNDPQLLKKK